MVNGYRFLGEDEEEGSWYMSVDVLWRVLLTCVWELSEKGPFL